MKITIEFEEMFNERSYLIVTYEEEETYPEYNKKMAKMVDTGEKAKENYKKIEDLLNNIFE